MSPPFVNRLDFMAVHASPTTSRNRGRERECIRLDRHNAHGETTFSGLVDYRQARELADELHDLCDRHETSHPTNY